MSLAHTGDHVAVAEAPGPVGVDIERVGGHRHVPASVTRPGSSRRSVGAVAMDGPPPLVSLIEDEFAGRDTSAVGTDVLESAAPGPGGPVSQTPLAGVNHLSLSVRDLDASLPFYRDVLGLTVFVEPYDGEVFAGRQSLLLAGRVVVGLQQHEENDGTAFDPTRTGLDHLSFHVSSRSDLDAWAARLDELAVEHSGVKELPGLGWMIELRDPDGIQLELFATT